MLLRDICQYRHLRLHDEYRASGYFIYIFMARRVMTRHYALSDLLASLFIMPGRHTTTTLRRRRFITFYCNFSTYAP